MNDLNKILESNIYKKPKSIGNYTVELYSDSDFNELLNFYEIIFPGYMSPELWAWKNKFNPSGKYLTFLMKVKNNIIAAYSISPKIFSIKGQNYSCVQSMDTMTKSEYQGRGISTYLANLTYDYANKILGKSFVYGFPNTNSYYLFKEKLNWKSFGKVNLYIKDVKNKEIEYNMNKDYVIKEIDIFNNKINDLWNKCKNLYPIIIRKDMQYLNWRFNQHPYIEYQKFLVFNNNNLVSYFILKKYKDSKDNCIGHIIDYLVNSRQPNERKELFECIEQYTLKRFHKNCIKISFWNNDSNLKNLILKKLHYDLVQMNTFFGFKIFNLSDKRLNSLNTLNNWYITMSNNDIF